MAPKSNTTPQEPTFKSGTPVEICSDDDGFRGSWFLGTVVRRTPPNKYLVQYDTLFDDESGKKPLKEVVDGFQLRPPAPRERDRTFRFGEEVDAFHNDGWWEGTITEDCGDGKFHVFFRGSREQILFDHKDLRLHREWFNGQWKPPLPSKEESKEHHLVKDQQEVPVTIEAKLRRKRVRDKPEEVQNAKELKAAARGEFSKGMLVEVSSDEDGFEGAWFAATIVERLEKDKYLVEYKSLRTDDDTAFLQEETDSMHVRPIPPQRKVNCFRMHDEVDALYNDGWWVGIITKVLTNSKYSVYFRDTEEEMVFQRSQLRVHQDWINGKWVVASQVIKEDVVDVWSGPADNVCEPESYHL